MISIDAVSMCRTCGKEIADTDLYCDRCGHAQPNVPAYVSRREVEPVDPGALPPLLPTQPARGRVIAFLILLAVLVFTTMPVLVIRGIFFGPDDVVLKYFAALADRDANAALAALEPGEADRDGNPMLTEAALRSDRYQPPTGFTLDRVDTNGADATAHVRYEVAGWSQATQVKVHRGAATGILNRWHVTEGLLLLPVAASYPGRYDVGGAQVNMGGDSVAGLKVFPGAYTVSLAEDPLVQTDPVTVVAGDVSGEGQSLDPRIRPAVTQEIKQQVRAVVDACARSTQNKPANCPFAVSTSYYSPPIRWEVISYPELDLRLSEVGTVAVNSHKEGAVRVSGGPTSYDTSPDTISFNVNGVATMQGGSVVFVPNTSG